MLHLQKLGYAKEAILYHQSSHCTKINRIVITVHVFIFHKGMQRIHQFETLLMQTLKRIRIWIYMITNFINSVDLSKMFFRKSLDRCTLDPGLLIIIILIKDCFNTFININPSTFQHWTNLKNEYQTSSHLFSQIIVRTISRFEYTLWSVFTSIKFCTHWEIKRRDLRRTNIRKKNSIYLFISESFLWLDWEYSSHSKALYIYT